MYVLLQNNVNKNISYNITDPGSGDPDELSICGSALTASSVSDLVKWSLEIDSL